MDFAFEKEKYQSLYKIDVQFWCVTILQENSNPGYEFREQICKRYTKKLINWHSTELQWTLVIVNA